MSANVNTANAADVREVAQATAFRLRAIQASFADDAADLRQEQLTEAVHDAIRRVFPDHRERFIAELQAHFPTLDHLNLPADAARDKVFVERDVIQRQLTPDELVDQLANLVHLLDDKQKVALTERLEGMGLARPREKEPAREIRESGTTLPPRAVLAAQDLMRVYAIRGLDLQRLIKLFGTLVDFLGRSDDLMWTTWKTVAPRSLLKRDVDLRAASAQYVSGDKAIEGVALLEHIDRLRKLLACLLAGLGKLGSGFARSHMRQLRPQEIEVQVRAQGGIGLKTVEHRCWERYLDLSRDMDEDGIEHALRGILVEQVETLMKRG